MSDFFIRNNKISANKVTLKYKVAIYIISDVLGSVVNSLKQNQSVINVIGYSVCSVLLPFSYYKIFF